MERDPGLLLHSWLNETLYLSIVTLAELMFGIAGDRPSRWKNG
uniref:Uncharacterized protein n=1 Tax=Sinorhizobium fredii (strain NBRC 101917 / NGR234) TaxID=394 RepID=Q6W1S6_SINFN|nr:Hypothetical protein RNGR10045 [Sinorhizobium fredii NGR234]